MINNAIFKLVVKCDVTLLYVRFNNKPLPMLSSFIDALYKNCTYIIVTEEWQRCLLLIISSGHSPKGFNIDLARRHNLGHTCFESSSSRAGTKIKVVILYSLFNDF